MTIFKGNTTRVFVRGFGELTEGSSDTAFRDALLIEPKISEYLTPEFLAKLQADGPAKPANTPKATANAG